MPLIINPFSYVEGMPRHWSDAYMPGELDCALVHLRWMDVPVIRDEYIPVVRHYLTHFIFAPGFVGGPDEYDTHGKHIHLESLMDQVSSLSTTAEILAWAWEARQVTGMDPI